MVASVDAAGHMGQLGTTVPRGRSSEADYGANRWSGADGAALGPAYGRRMTLADVALAAGLVAALAAFAKARRVVQRRSPARPAAAADSPSRRVDEVMLPAPTVVSEELVVEEIRRRLSAGLSDALPVIDHGAHAIGVLHARDVAALEPLARASCLVAELTDRDPALLAAAAADADEVLGREAVARNGFALAIDGRRRLIGVAYCPPPEKEPPWSSPASGSTSPATRT